MLDFSTQNGHILLPTHDSNSREPFFKTGLIQNGNITLRQGVTSLCDRVECIFVQVWPHLTTRLWEKPWEARLWSAHLLPSSAVFSMIFVAWGAILWFHVSSHCGRCQELSSSKYPWGKKRGCLCGMLRQWKLGCWCFGKTNPTSFILSLMVQGTRELPACYKRFSMNHGTFWG